MTTPFKLLIFGVPLSLVLFAFGLSMGEMDASLLHLFDNGSMGQFVLLHLRFPRIITAFIVGGCLAVAGASFQGVFQNDLADPYILGVSSGAGLGAAVSIFLKLSRWSPFLIPICALVGALISILVVYAIVRARPQTQQNQFILAGIIVNTFFSACMALLLYLANQDLFSIMQWLLGDLEMAHPMWLWFSGFSLLILTAVLCCLAYSLNIISLGDDTATALGVSVPRMRLVIFLLASFLTGIAVATAGIIGFVGLIVPHMIRRVAKDDFRWLIPLSLLYGGIFLMCCDLISKNLMRSGQIPIGIICSFVGAPFFLFLLLRKPR
ncbi:MAG: iron complex transport system permease protein [Candidatus Marinamargulisbacteria bacterium]|jgi:iron complex transport system permease protein